MEKHFLDLVETSCGAIHRHKVMRYQVYAHEKDGTSIPEGLTLSGNESGSASSNSSGYYEVFIWSGIEPSGVINQPFIINFDGGTTTILVTFQGNVSGGVWRSLGVFRFSAVTSGSMGTSADADGDYGCRCSAVGSDRAKSLSSILQVDLFHLNGVKTWVNSQSSISI